MVWGENRARDKVVPIQVLHREATMLPRMPVGYNFQCAQQHGAADAIVNELAVGLRRLPCLRGLEPVVLLNAA